MAKTFARHAKDRRFDPCHPHCYNQSMALKARLIEENGTRAWLRVYWGDDCPSCGGSGKPGYHNARIYLTETGDIADWKLGGEVADYPDDKWPTKCDHCSAVVTPDAIRQVFRKRRYDSPSGDPEPGDLYFIDWYRAQAGGCVFHGDTCDGKHLFAILPNGDQWDIDGRASNCTMPKDNVHRCWIRSGTPPDLTVGKNGNTCKAGAGSIMSGNYHGFLRNGSFT